MTKSLDYLRFNAMLFESQWMLMGPEGCSLNRGGKHGLSLLARTFSMSARCLKLQHGPTDRLIANRSFARVLNTRNGGMRFALVTGT